MSAILPSNSRTLFEQIVIEECEEGLAEYGLCLESTAPDLVCFTSNTAFVEVFHDTRSGEVGMDIGLQPRSVSSGASPEANGVYTIGRRTYPNVFSLWEIITHYCRDHGSPMVGSFTGTNLSALVQGLHALMESLTQCAGPFLRGDRAAYESLKIKRSEAAAAYTAREHLEYLRRRAAEAWRDRNYNSLISALEELGSARTPADDAKLKYAYKHRSD